MNWLEESVQKVISHAKSYSKCAYTLACIIRTKNEKLSFMLDRQIEVLIASGLPDCAFQVNR
jgi:hypothetical protein